MAVANVLAVLIVWLPVALIIVLFGSMASAAPGYETKGKIAVGAVLLAWLTFGLWAGWRIVA